MLTQFDHLFLGEFAYEITPSLIGSALPSPVYDAPAFPSRAILVSVYPCESDATLMYALAGISVSLTVPFTVTIPSVSYAEELTCSHTTFAFTLLESL